MFVLPGELDDERPTDTLAEAADSVTEPEPD
jgi:hypothetical protein